jgi:hypothetical protein
LAFFRLETPRHLEEHEEDVWVKQLSGGELRGLIKDRRTGATYRFQGRIVFDEMVGYYWSADELRDIGTFKFEQRYDGKVLSGPLTVLDTKARETKADVEYSWHYLPPKIVRRFKHVREGISLIDKAGLFSNDEFSAGEEIGILSLRKSTEQGEYTLKLKGIDQEVKKPWRFLNHSCDPNGELIWEEERIILKAKSRILPQTELTIDYLLLPETIGSPFKCHCEKCQEQEEDQRQTIGGV